MLASADYCWCRAESEGLRADGLQVVDERMWGDEDKPEPDQKPGEDQQGKDAPAQVCKAVLTLKCL